MAYPYGQYPQQQQPSRVSSMAKKILGLIVLMALIVTVALLWLMGYSINTILDYNLGLQITQLANQGQGLPTAATNTFNAVVNYQLVTYGFGYILIAVLAIAGTIAALFGMNSNPAGEDGMGM
jgi:hypothetical protein